MTTETLTRPELDQSTTGPENVAHIVDQRDPKNNITGAIVEGTTVTALCGYTWVPYRDPKGRPVCGECVEAYGQAKD